MYTDMLNFISDQRNVKEISFNYQTGGDLSDW